MATEASKIRSVAITGQGGVGKTSVADALIFAAGGNNRLGRVDDESSLFDSEPEEIRRRTTISMALHSAEWSKHALTVIDTPGQGNFLVDAHSALRGVGGMVLVVDPTSSLRAETGKLLAWAAEEKLPCLVFVNRMDKPEQDIDGVLAALGDLSGRKVTPVQLPMGSADSFKGIVDLMSGKAAVYGDDSGKFSTEDVPNDLADRVEELKAVLVEDAAEGNDELLEKYLDAGELSAEETAAGLKEGVAGCALIPVLYGSAESNIGFPQLLDAIVDLLPAPSELPAEQGASGGEDSVEIAPDESAPFAGLVFKTIVDPHAGHLSVLRVMSGTISGDSHLVNTSNGTKERAGHLFKIDGKKTRQVDKATVGDVVALAKLKATHSGDTLADPSHSVTIRPLVDANPAISFAIAAKKRGEEDKATQGLMRLAEEDRGLRVERDEVSGDILLSGSGQLHVEVACERLQRKYGVEVELKAPKVPYRETIRKGVKAHGRLKKQTGGHGQFADCKIEVAPLPAGGGFEFESKVVGGAIPRGFIPAVEKGVIEAMKRGSIAGYPVVDVKVTLYDGQHHDVDSSEMAFKVAGSMAFRDALEQANPCLLEPYAQISVEVPGDCMGDVMGDLNSRRAKVEGMEQAGANEVIRAKVPMSEVLRYAPDLTSMTSGRGSFELGFSHYEQLPEHLKDKVVQQSSSDE